MIIERQEKIDAFVPEEYWTIDIEVTIAGKTYKAALSKVDGKPFSCHSKEEADAILARIPEQLRVSSVVKAEKNVSPRPPFTTSSMQQEAYTKFHFSNSRTQAVAQRLYEGQTIAGEHVGLITYMRTDSTRISPEFFKRHAEPYIIERWGKEYVGALRSRKKKDTVQDAHEAIRPTGTHRTPELVAKYLSSDEAKPYRLIYCRAMASLMAPKRTEATTAILSGNGLEFTLKGSRTLFPGFTVVYGEFDDEEDFALPELQEGLVLEQVKINAEQKFTKPEPLFNEASIVKAMEEKGIGRPSTYATTIDTLLKRKYVSSNKGVLSPTEDGKLVIAVLKKYFPDVVSTSYTAEMESTLDKVEAGEETFLQTMHDFYDPFIENFEEVKDKIYKTPPEYTGENCPECGAPLVYKKSKKGDRFIGCSAFPNCRYIKSERAPDEPTGENCPECGSPLVYKTSKKGERFVGCSAFPKCRFTKSLDGKVSEPKAKKVYTEEDFVKPCPKCKTGHLVVKQGKKTEFLACTNFPRCRYHEWIDKKGKGEGK